MMHPLSVKRECFEPIFYLVSLLLFQHVKHDKHVADIPLLADVSNEGDMWMIDSFEECKNIMLESVFSS